MDLSIRAFNPDDYPAAVGVFNAVNPDNLVTVAETRYFDEHRDVKYHFGRFVAESGGHVVGVAHYDQPPWMYDPRSFYFDVEVPPSQQGRGIGRALYERLLAELRAFDPRTIRCNTREDRERGVRFLLDRGFAEEMRGWESRLDVASFDPSPYAGVDERVRSRGIAIRTLRELEADPDYRRRLYELHMELEADVPQPAPFTRPSFEDWSAHVYENPNLLPDAFFVALDGDEYVGASALWATQASPDLEVGLTAVKREYRRRGIALALKLRAVAYARERGAPVVRTWNEARNRPILAINERMGFRKMPASLTFVKRLAGGDPA